MLVDDHAIVQEGYHSLLQKIWSFSRSLS